MSNLKTKKTVMITGASGNMGFAGFKEIFAEKEKYNLVLLLRDSQKNREMFAPYSNDSSLRIVWGDLGVYEDVLDAVTGADIVLHVGGMVSPAADYYPKQTLKTNVEAAENIVRAVKEQPNKDEIHLVYIGTVAQTGDRNPPIHWARTGDPIKISIYDHYAISKTIAESIFAESGLKRWVSLRQSGILHPGILNNFDPIMYHVPFNGVLEWATLEDSATLMLRLCADDIPENFWRSFYNIGSGAQYRLTNYEFEEFLLDTINMGPTKKLFEPNWFILRNFHGQWYADSDKLDDILKFRHNLPVRQYFKRLGESLPAYFKLAKLAPRGLVKKLLMKPVTKTPVYGTMHWIENNNTERINAYFGSRENWENIGSWDKFEVKRPTTKVSLLDHGYDEAKPTNELDIQDMKKAAAFRGGDCLSDTMEKGDLFTPLKWKCAHGHEFAMSPNLALKGGHWCPEELPFPWDYDKEARVNPFFAQVWHPIHGENENNFYDEGIYKDFPEYKN